MDKSSVLLQSDNFGTMLGDLIKIVHAKKKSLSLASITRACQIKSRGYMTEVLQNKRTLNQTHLSHVIRLLELDALEAEVLKSLHKYSRTKDASVRDVLAGRLTNARNALKMSYRLLPDDLAAMFFAFKVFAAFGLFKNKPTRAQLLSVFGRTQYWDVDHALALLQKHKLVAKENGFFTLPKNQLLFNTSSDGMSLKQFVKCSLLDASNCVDKWFDRGHVSRFHSTILCVKQTEYERYLGDLKNQLIKDQVELARSDGDFLVHYNVSIYPVSANE